ncbi:hypothetical protein BKA83DRAFT_4129161 [Pisolithus microcarpus]|nr:hypothetical protein BKA83DRAFT_4129161 [Pisolithus microcarpus]
MVEGRQEKKGEKEVGKKAHPDPCYSKFRSTEPSSRKVRISPEVLMQLQRKIYHLNGLIKQNLNPDLREGWMSGSQDIVWTAQGMMDLIVDENVCSTATKPRPQAVAHGFQKVRPGPEPPQAVPTAQLGSA